MNNNDMVPPTLTQFIIRSQPPRSRGEFTMVMIAIQTAVKVIEKNIRRAGMQGLFGYLATGDSNATGDTQAKLDVIANNAFKAYLMTSTGVCALGSEEEEEIILIDSEHRGDYLIFFDPLDGSSNVDANVSVGSIWGVWRVPKGVNVSSLTEAKSLLPLLKCGDIVSAGYAMYGNATNLVLTTGHGVDGFTLDPNIGEFLLTHPHMTMPKLRAIYSVNEGYYSRWRPWFRSYLDHIKTKANKEYTARYIGSMVADVHRTLLYGGIFCYPSHAKSPEGKLRLLYEAAPIAMLIEQAGGKAWSGTGRILDQTIRHLHQRVPVYIGSRGEIDLCAAFKEHNDNEIVVTEDGSVMKKSNL